MSAHTPGPWKIITLEGVDGHLFLCHDDGTENIPPLVAKVYDHQHADAEANARLIAAAPELLEALRELLDQLEGIGIPEWAGAEGLYLGQAAAAIAKAEGGDR